MTVTSIVVLIVALIIVAAVVLYLLQQRRSKRLCSHLGPEYERAAREHGSPLKAEQALVAREKRMEKVHVHPLTAPERDRFAAQWHEIQAHFVDDPPVSIREADHLVYEVMLARGYPMSDFERR